MEKEYDKNRLIGNIEFLIKRNDLKIGDLETQCGVSVGYLSRLKNNESNDVSPSAEMLLRLSKLLNVSLTSLLISDYSSMTETELFIQKFLEDMINKTESNQLTWERNARYSLFDEITGDSFNSLPIANKQYDNYGNERYVYTSLFTDQQRYPDDYYYTLCLKDVEYYLVSVSSEDLDSSEYELYILLPDESFKKICCSSDGSNPGIIRLVSDLYTSAKKSSKRIRIDEDVKKSLEDFLSSKKDS